MISWLSIKVHRSFSAAALTSGFGQVIFPAVLIVSGDAAATVANLLSHDLLVRLSLVAALVAVACHIIWTFLFYELFEKPTAGDDEVLLKIAGLR